MRIESQHDRLSAKTRGEPSSLLKNVRMAAMHSIEIADRNGSAAQAGRNGVEIAEEFHGCIILTPAGRVNRCHTAWLFCAILTLKVTWEIRCF